MSNFSPEIIDSLTLFLKMNKIYCVICELEEDLVSGLFFRGESICLTFRCVATPETFIEPMLHFYGWQFHIVCKGRAKNQETLITSNAPSILKNDGPFIFGRNSSAL